ncbi:MAG: hypothetical protein KBB94_08300 [Legionellaceae bacterium]|nr:hypothetical protein [Legionellaceae bacterium]MBP9775428.1 hypothetical protein [Legionellaceae bacterium]
MIQNEDINGICEVLAADLEKVLHQNLFGIYLIGSLTYGDFDYGSNDLDFLIVLHVNLSKNEITDVKKIHIKLAQRYPEWAKRRAIAIYEYYKIYMLHCFFNDGCMYWLLREQQEAYTRIV